MAKFSQERRNFIKALTAALASALLLWRYLTPKSVNKPAVLLRVPLSEIPVEGAYVDSKAKVAIIREKDGIFAVSLVCTHLGCTVTVAGDGLSCPCHGSRFDRRGNVLRGPADRRLALFKAIENGGVVEVIGG